LMKRIHLEGRVNISHRLAVRVVTMHGNAAYINRVEDNVEHS
jgi:hypothetical protein